MFALFAFPGRITRSTLAGEKPDLLSMAFDTFWGRADLAKWRVESLSPEESKFLPSQRRLDFSSGRSNAAGRDLIDLAKSGDLHSLQVASCTRAPAVSQLLAVTVQLLVEVGADCNYTDELGYASDALCPCCHTHWLVDEARGVSTRD